MKFDTWAHIPKEDYDEALRILENMREQMSKRCEYAWELNVLEALDRLRRGGKSKEGLPHGY